MAIDIQEILDNIASHVMATGHLDVLLGYVSKQSPTNGITGALYVDRITPVRTSGLANTTIRLEIELQIYSSTYQTPYDHIDSNLVKATDAIFTALLGDFDLGGEARHLDVLGAHGKGAETRSGMMNIDGKEFRVFQVIIPVIVDSVWDQVA